jgi:hypothetical protein
MAKLNVSLGAVKYHFKSSYYEYQGISRKYFPKWEGWSIIDFGGEPSEFLVDTFYKDFFWDKLQCDSIDNQHIADLLMAFAVISGKKKAISKLQRVIGAEVTTELSFKDILLLNTKEPSYIFLELFAECVEFYISVNTPERIKPLLSIYYKYIHER